MRGTVEAAVEGHDGEVLVREHGGVDAAREDGDGQRDAGRERGIESCERGELGELEVEFRRRGGGGGGKLGPCGGLEGVFLQRPEAAQG